MINWAICLICQRPKCKQEWETRQILTTQVYKTLMNTAHIKKDDDMIRRILGEDLIALETKYHKGCYKQYTAVASTSQKEGKSRAATYEEAFMKVVE